MRFALFRGYTLVSYNCFHKTLYRIIIRDFIRTIIRKKKSYRLLIRMDFQRHRLRRITTVHVYESPPQTGNHLSDEKTVSTFNRQNRRKENEKETKRTFGERATHPKRLRRRDFRRDCRAARRRRAKKVISMNLGRA